MGALQDPEEPSPTGTDFHKQWAAFGRRRYLALFLLYTWVPVCIGLFFLSRDGVHDPLLSLAMMGGWLAAAAAAVWWAGEFRCPRCRRRYAALGYKRTANFTRGFFDKVCANCKLTKFERLS